MSRLVSVLLFVLACGPLFASEKHPEYNFDAADSIYGSDAMNAAREELRHSHGSMKIMSFAADRFEILSGDGPDVLLWDFEASYGDDYDKLVVKTAGLVGVNNTGLEEAEVQILWSHAMSPFFDLRTGLRYDLEPEPLPHFVIGAVGTAPYWLDIDAALYLSGDGDLTAGVDLEYEWLFTQSLSMLSRTEIAASAQVIEALETGSGLNEIAQSLRLRYAVTGRFIPYAGLQWSRAFGGSADFIEAAGDDASEFTLIAGVNFWF